MQPDSRKATTLWPYVVLLIIVLLAVVLRLLASDIRPLHSDEGVNFHFIQELFKKGYYPYSHKNYHGPLYFYLTAGLVSLCGVEVWAFRLCPLLCSVAMPLLLLLLWKHVHQRILLVAACALSGSASLVFYGRYAIHEPLFTMASLWFGISVFQWLVTRERSWHVHAGLSLACLIATKETFVISVFCIFFAFVATAICQSCRLGWKYSRISSADSAVSRLLSRLHLEAFEDLYLQRHVIALGFFVCVLCVCLCFSGGLQWSGGLRELFLAVPQWIGRNESDQGHFKPILYYAQMIVGTPGVAWIQPFVSKHASAGAELPLGVCLLTLLPLLLRECFGNKSLFRRSEDAYFFIFVSVWALLSFLVYSILNYKTPWLIINISMPLCLVFGCQIFLLTERFRVEGYAVLALALCIMMYQTVYVTFARPYSYVRQEPLWSLLTLDRGKTPGDVHPYTYVHTSPGFLSLLEDIDSYAEKTGNKDPRILVAVGQYWPLPYYQHRSGYTQISYLPKKEFKREDFKRYDILIYSAEVTERVPHTSRKYYRLSEVQEAHTFFVYPETSHKR